MTTDHIYELQKSIIAALNGDSALSAIINGVYDNVPADAKFPYVALDNITANDSSTRTTGGWHIKMTVKAFSRSRESKEALNILAEIRRILDNAALAPTGCMVTFIREADNNINRLSDGQTWVGNIVFIIILQEGSSFVGNGNQFLIKIGNGASPTEIFTTIGGLRNASINLENKLLDSSNLYSGKWRTFVSNGGVAALSLNGDGFFTDSAAEEVLRAKAFSGSSNNYEIILGSNDKISGAFIISSYKRNGNIDAEEEFTIGLQSSGVVLFTAGA